MGRNSFHPCVLDPQLLLEEGQLVVQPVDLGRRRVLRCRSFEARATMAVNV